MRVLVLGGTGKVGAPAVTELAASGARVRVFARNVNGAALPAGCEPFAGDLDDPARLAAAFEGVDRVAVIPPLHPEEGRILVGCVRAAAQAGVDRLALISVIGLEGLPDALHLTAKRDAEREIDRLGLPAVVLRANNFFQNDLAVRPMIDQGAYPVPLGSVGCHSVDCRDVGRALSRALLADEGAGTKPAVVGPDAITGRSAAATWAAALGHDVRYVSDDLDAWAANVRNFAPGWLVDNLLVMYRHFGEHGSLATAAEIAETARLLRRPARRYADFVAEQAAPAAG